MAANKVAAERAVAGEEEDDADSEDDDEDYSDSEEDEDAGANGATEALIKSAGNTEEMAALRAQLAAMHATTLMPINDGMRLVFVEEGKTGVYGRQRMTPKAFKRHMRATEGVAASEQIL